MITLFFLLILAFGCICYAGGYHQDNKFIFLVGAIALFIAGVTLYAEGVDRLQQVTSEGVFVYEQVSGQTSPVLLYASLMLAAFGVFGFGIVLFSWQAERG